MENFLARLKIQAEENPIVAIGAGIAAVAAVSQLINAVGSFYGRRTWSKEVDRRSKMHRR